MKGTNNGYDDPSKKAWITLNDETLSRGQWERLLEEQAEEIATLKNELSQARLDIRGLTNTVETLQFDEKIADEAIEKLHEDNQTLQAALSASQEALAEARKVIRNTTNILGKQSLGYANPSDCFKAYLALNELVASWDSVETPTENEAPSEVTLAKEEIEFLANYLGYADDDNEFSAPSYLIPDSLYKKIERITDFTIFANHYTLAKEYYTPTNRAAIEKRRKELESKAD